MATINQFATLVRKLQQSPDNFQLKLTIAKLLPPMRVLAETEPRAGYELAQAYSPNSPQYKQAMMQSADLGFTNAMLAASRFLVKSNKPEDLEKAAHYIKQIRQAQDTYISTNSNELLAEYPQLAKAVQTERTKVSNGNHAHRFFPAQPARKDEITFERQEIYQP